jgi:hypothetical protein
MKKLNLRGFSSKINSERNPIKKGKKAQLSQGVEQKGLFVCQAFVFHVEPERPKPVLLTFKRSTRDGLESDGMSGQPGD